MNDPASVGRFCWRSKGFLREEAGLFSPGESGFGHSAIGGILGWADPDHQLTFVCVTNSLDWRVRSPRCLRFCKSMFLLTTVVSYLKNFVSITLLKNIKIKKFPRIATMSCTPYRFKLSRSPVLCILLSMTNREEALD